MKTSKQNLKLSTAGKVIVSLSLAYAGSAALAANIEAVGGTSVTQKGKVDVVNIVAPNQQGLSHNQYNKYNVSKHGAVLNNSLTDGKSQLAGSLKANTNFGNKAASVILNEVVSKNPSLILGKQEVFGMAADYVLANPNGIVHKGGSIINAPRASLVVGKAEIANGQIAALRVGDKNSAAVLAVEGGLQGGKVLDLIAPKVVVKQNAKVAASESVNLLAGNNKVNYVDGTVEVFEQAANAPVLDGQVFGSINSGAIRIHTTDKRATLSINNQSGSSLNASEDLEVKSAGNLNMRAAKLSAGNNMLLSSKNTIIDGVVSEKTKKTGSSGHASNHAVRVSQDKIKGQVKEAENAKKSAERHASNLLNAYNKALASAQSARSTANQAKGAADAARAKANQARDAANAAEQAANADRRNSKLRTAARNARNAANRANSEANRLENIARTKENDARAKSNTADREREKFVVAENAAVNAIAALESARIAAANVQNTGNIRIDMNNVFTTEAGNRTVQSYTGTSLTAKNLLTFDSANDVNIKGASVNAKNLLVRAENLNTGSEKTVNRSASNVDRVKGLWFDRINESSSNETLHDTNIKVGDTAILDMRNTVNLVSTNLDVAKDVNINAAKAVKMSGAVETDVQKRRQDKKNESAALQTGYAAQDSSMQTYHATNIQAGGNVLLKANEAVNLVGAKVQAGSTMLVETKHIGLDVQGTTDSAKRDDKYKMWGGLAGAREGLNDQTDETLHGAALISKGTVTLNAENDVRIRGSAVKGTEGAYVNAIGKTEISHVLASSNSLNRQRVGTIFNITKDRTHKESNIQTVTGSTLKSDADLSVSSGKDIALLGSKLEAARNVTLQSYEGDIGVVAAAAHNQHYSSSFNIRGKVSGNANVKKLEATGGVGLVFTKETNRTDEAKHTGSTVTGKNVSIKSAPGTVVNNERVGSVNIKGSTINGSDSVSIAANKDILVEAAHDKVVSSTTKRVTDVGISTTVSANNGAPKVSVTVGVDSAYNNTHKATSTAKVSEINGGKVSFDTDVSLKHEGTKINATGGLSERADEIVHSAAKNTVDTHTVEHKGGIALTVGADTNKVISGKLAVHGSGGVSDEKQQTSTVAEINSGKEITLTSDGTVSDEGTKYNAEGNIGITAGKYINEAAVDSSSKVSNKGGAELYVGASTSDMATIDTVIGGNMSYAHEHGGKTQAHKGSLNGKNVDVSVSDSATIAADITAKENVSLSAANGVTLTESKNTENRVTGGFGLGAEVGVKIVPEAGVAAPTSVGVNANINVGKKDAVTGVGSNVQAGYNIDINGNKKVDLQGTNLIAENNVSVKGDQITSHAVTTKNDEVDVGVGGKLKLGLSNDAEIVKVGVGANVDVKRDKEHSHTTNVIRGDNEVSIAGNFQGAGVKLTGTDVMGSKVDITNAHPEGTVEHTSVSNYHSNVDVGVGLYVEAKQDIKKWTEKEVRTWLDRCGYKHVEVTEVEKIEKLWKLHNIDGSLRVKVGGGGGDSGGKINIVPNPQPKPEPQPDPVPTPDPLDPVDPVPTPDPLDPVDPVPTPDPVDLEEPEV